MGAIAVRARATVLGELERDDLLQRAVGDHDRGGVDRVVRDDPLEALGDVDDLARVTVAVIGLAQLLAVGQAVVEARVAADDRLRDQLRDPLPVA